MWRMGLAYLMYSLCRVVFYCYNADLLHVEHWVDLVRIELGGLRFDTVAILYTNVLVIVLHLLPARQRLEHTYQYWLAVVYFVCNIPSLLLNMCDVVYYRFTMRRTTMSIFSEFEHDDPIHFVRFVYDYWGITLTTLALVILWVVLYRLVRATPKRCQSHTSRPRYGYSLASIALCVPLFLLGVRGHARQSVKPITPSYASIYTDCPHQYALVLNTPFTLMKTLNRPALEPLEFYSHEELGQLYSPIYQASSASPLHGHFAGRNVVVIIWESLSREWSGMLNAEIPDYEGYTPFLDSLMKRSFYFDCAYSGASQSVDAMPAIFASVPRPRVSFVNSAYGGNKINSWVRELRQEGYHTAFFHNGANGSMGFDAFARMAGFDAYYGMTEYANDQDYDGNWGIWDEPFLQYVVRTIGTLPQPFLVSEFTTSSHHPFVVPEEFARQHAEGPFPHQRPIRYTDYALSRFFEEARKQSWYHDTLFIILGDHGVAGWLDQYKTNEGIFRIPIIFYDPRQELVGVDRQTIVQQADLFPTLMNLMGIRRPILAYGSDMFDRQAKHFAVNMINGVYQFVLGDYILQHDGHEVHALYHRLHDPMLRHNLKDCAPDRLAELLPWVQAYLQDFHHRMICNQLVLE